MTRPEPPPDHVTPYDRFAWSDEVVEHLLVTGEHARELIAYFGAREYEVLVSLARESKKAVPIPNAPRVYIVPGIMGSQLGRLRRPPLPNDVLWLDPVDVSLGALSMLRLPPNGAGTEHKHAPLQDEPPAPEETRIVPLGVVLYTYLRLKLHLRIAGLTPVFHDYDWRLGVDELGRGLAGRIRREGGPAAIVAHSMGGLVTRAALACEGMSDVQRVVLLGTPNSGSFAPVQALRGVYAVVRKIARLSHAQSAESLAAEVFSTFPSLYHLLPLPGRESGQDFFEASHWPTEGPAPNPELLLKARDVLGGLAGGDERFVNVIGAGQETVTRATRRNGEFVYTITRNGDGTVPVDCAELAGARSYYTRVAHSDLARDEVVARAVAELLLEGETELLATRWSRGTPAEARITDTQLRRTHTEKVDFAQMTPEARQDFLRNLNEPPQLTLTRPARLRPKRKTAAHAKRARQTVRRARRGKK